MLQTQYHPKTLSPKAKEKFSNLPSSPLIRELNNKNALLIITLWSVSTTCLNLDIFLKEHTHIYNNTTTKKKNLGKQAKLGIEEFKEE
jgi:hypothetical protein